MHKLTIKYQEPEKSALCEHSIQFDLLLDWNNSKVSKTEAHYSKRFTSEARFISSHSHIMNQSNGNSLPRVYRRLTTVSILLVRKANAKGSVSGFEIAPPGKGGGSDKHLAVN